MNKPNNPPAFPVQECWRAKEHEEGHSCRYDDEQGMTLRDYFAAKAMQSLIPDNYRDFEAGIAKNAYQMADAMLAEREKNA